MRKLIGLWILSLTLISTLTACSAPLKDTERDIVIVGSGGAGLAAAIAAHDAGADVIVLEMLPIAGGNTNRATGGMNASETKFQAAAGITDTNELFIEETMKGGYEKNDRDLVTFMAENSSEAIDWLDSMGITLSDVTFSGGFSVARIHRPADGSPVGSYLVEGLLREIDKRGIEIKYLTTVTEVIKSGDKVTGVKANVLGEGDITYKAKAVIMATGGFGANLEMVTKYRPELAGYVTTNHGGAQGTGILMIEAIGGALVDMDQIQIHPTVEQSTATLITEALRGEGAILVNASGLRFTNELLTRDKVSAAEIAQEGSYAWILFDDTVRANNKSVVKYINQGLTVQGNTVEELAAAMGVSVENLSATLKTYNGYVKTGVDAEFGRATGLEPIEAAPFYAIKIAPGIHHTMGGVKINTNTEVLSTEGTVIKGLFAAGEVTGGVHGGNRIGGNAVADIMVFGRQAGLKSAEYALANGGHGVRETVAKEVSEEPEVVKADDGIPAQYVDGTYTATKNGNNGPVKVEVVVKDGYVTAVNILENMETGSLFKNVLEQLIPNIIRKQTPEVDSIAGATYSSTAVKEAIKEILDANRK